MVRELDESEIRALHYELLLKDIISTAEKLPPFPDTAWQAMALIKRGAAPEQVEALIMRDQNVAAGVIALSQSGYYGRMYAIGTLRDAIVNLQPEKLIEVILAASASRYFEGEIAGYEQHHRKLWKHSVATALFAERIARQLKQKKSLTVFTSALLHDIGKTVLDLYSKIYLQASLADMKKGTIQLIQVERNALGIDHQELGEIIARRWRFPIEVVSVIGCHHTPEKAPFDKHIVATVYAANRIASAMEGKDEFEGPFDASKDPVFERLGLTPQTVADLQTELAEAMDEMHLFLSNRGA